MTVNELADKKVFNVIAIPDPSCEISGAYVGDLLSWVMGRASKGNVWVTIMTNINILAVASLSECSCIILTEGVTIQDDILKSAIDKGINILSSQRNSYEVCGMLKELI